MVNSVGADKAEALIGGATEVTGTRPHTTAKAPAAHRRPLTACPEGVAEAANTANVTHVEG
jgi:hypothetical protein